ncbi:MAG TPA: cobalamin-binding protein [Firmicutes bacterium]|nr:cobalamin-binding protein [Bacillota bacterium]
MMEEEPSMYPYTGNVRGWSARVLALLLVLVLSLAVVAGGGCGKKPSAQEPAGAGGNPGGAGGSPAGPWVTLQDWSGRQVTLSHRPERIVSFAPSNTEILFALGAGDRVVGVTDFCNYPEEAKDKPRLGGALNPNLEQLTALQPDLVLCIAGMDQFLAKLQEMGIPTFVVQPTDLADTYRSIEVIGGLIGEKERAGEIVTQMKDRVGEIQKKLEAVPPEKRLRVFYEVWYDPIQTVGPGSFVHDALAAAGAVNVAADAPRPFSEYSLETLVKKDPQAIITTFKESYQALQTGKRPGWEKMTAVKKGRILLMDPDIIIRPGPRLVQGMEQIAHFLYPQVIP